MDFRKLVIKICNREFRRTKVWRNILMRLKIKVAILRGEKRLAFYFSSLSLLLDFKYNFHKKSIYQYTLYFIHTLQMHFVFEINTSQMDVQHK